MSISTTPAKTPTKIDFRKELRTRAAADFPAVFGGEPVPLAIGVDHVIRMAWPDIGRCRIKLFLTNWCRSRAYLQAMAAGGPRYYLDGSTDGEITEDQQDHARQLLEARQQRNLAQYEATLERLKRERRERLEAQYDKGIAAHRAGEAPEAPAAPPAPPVIVPAASEAPRPARPTLQAGTVQVFGNDRKPRNVQVVSRRKFSLNKRESAARS